jgi:hypothetical protein
MCVAPVVNTSVFFVLYCGVGMSGQGPSAHCLEGEEVVIVNGARDRRKAVNKTWSEKKKTVASPGIVE